MNAPLSRQALRAPEHRAVTPPVQVQTPAMAMRSATSATPPSLAGLKVSSPHDAAEHEATQVARRIVSLPPAPVSNSSARFAGLVPTSAQRTPAPASAPAARSTSTPVPGLPGRVARAAAAVDHLLATRDQWLDTVQHELRGAHGTWLLAPAERYANSLQGALMVREGPRRVADGCETGDWCHVDVYLTKTLDYRALLCTGSRYDEVAVRWLRDRHSRFVAVGGPVPGAAHTVRYPGDDDPVVALLTEVLVAELVAATWWADVS